MPRTPHYIPSADAITCTKCGERKHKSEFYLVSADSDERRKTCKTCRRAQARQVSDYSNCTNCPKLEECNELTRTLVLVDGEYEYPPLPCDNGFTPPKSAKWNMDKILSENGVIRV